jgi:hypothetical protein
MGEKRLEIKCSVEEASENWKSNYLEFLRLSLLSFEKTIQENLHKEFGLVKFMENPHLLQLNLYSEISLDFYCFLVVALLEKNYGKLRKVFMEDLKQNTSQMLMYKMNNLNSRDSSETIDLDQGRVRF